MNTHNKNKQTENMKCSQIIVFLINKISDYKEKLNLENGPLTILHLPRDDSTRIAR